MLVEQCASYSFTKCLSTHIAINCLLSIFAPSAVLQLLLQMCIDPLSVPILVAELVLHSAW